MASAYIALSVLMRHMGGDHVGHTMGHVAMQLSRTDQQGP